MRALTAGVIAAKNSTGNRPELLVRVHFATGTRFLAERDRTFNAQAYEGLIDQLGPITLDLQTLLHTMSLDVNNLAATAFSASFLANVPEGTAVDVLLHFQEVGPDAEADLVPLFKGEIKSVAYDFAQVRLELVERGAKLPNFSGAQITTTILPRVDPGEVGKVLPIVYGRVKRTRAVVAAKLPETVLTAPVGATDTIFTVQDTSAFPLSGSCKVGDETFTYSSKTGTTFNGVSRGGSGTHAVGAGVRQVGAETYVLAGHASQAVANVLVGGGPTVTPLIVNLSDAALIPGKVVTSIAFNDRPQGVPVVLGSGTGRVRINFDAFDGSTTADNPGRAFPGGAGFTAMNHATLKAISSPQQRLVLRRFAPVGNLGTLTKVELVARFMAQTNSLTVQPEMHFSTAAVGSVGPLGTMGTPTAEASRVDVGGFDNIQHAHPPNTQTAIIRPQLATNVSPANAWSNPNNGFDGSVSTNALSLFSLSGFDLFIMRAIFPYAESRSGSVTSIRIGTISSNGSDTRGFIVTFAPLVGPGIAFQVPAGLPLNSLVKSAPQAMPNISFADVLGGEIRVISNSGTGASSLQDCWLEVTYVEQEVLTQQPPVRDTTPNYEHRADVSLSLFPSQWANFQFADGTITFPFGSTPEQPLHIFEMWMEVEFSGSGNATAEESTEVVADVDGQVDDGVGTYTGTPNALIENGADVVHHLMRVHGGLPTADVELASFTAGRAALNAFVSGWALAGVIREAVRFGDLLKVLGLNCRADFVWEDGRARLLVVPSTAPGAVHTFQPGPPVSNVFPGMSVARRPLDEVINDLSVQYQLLQGGGSGGYDATAEAENAPSIAALRRRTHQVQLNFVRSTAVANNFRDYLISRRKDAKRRLTIQAPLDALHVQRGDFVDVTEPRLDLSATRCRVLRVTYAPGRAVDGGQDVLGFEVEEF